MNLLRKKDLHDQVGVAKSTVADWVEDFAVYIPKVKQGNVTYYKPETIDVLKFIKQCRDQNYHKAQIMQLLSEKGFPVTVDEAIEDVKQAIEADNPRDNLMNMMMMTGQAVAKLADQDERLNGHDESLRSLEERQRRQEELAREILRETREVAKDVEDVNSLRQQVNELQEAMAATQEALDRAEQTLQRKATIWGRIFGRK
ncbi:MerR family transcriptional regulator [Terribacillus halophilus]|uniref:MerR family transcriptional regulator n=1 Tax=Terribacillus halophilus TaxID=361279 RepID=UPI000985D54F|nr:MerR family transcriptional regulator [Terribacillus halophilus]